MQKNMNTEKIKTTTMKRSALLARVIVRSLVRLLKLIVILPI